MRRFQTHRSTFNVVEHEGSLDCSLMKDIFHCPRMNHAWPHCISGSTLHSTEDNASYIHKKGAPPVT